MLWVRSVVPNPGMITAEMPFRSNCRESKARTATNKAKVESSPPDNPIRTDRQAVCCNRLRKPAACNERTSRSEPPVLADPPARRATVKVLGAKPRVEPPLKRDASMGFCGLRRTDISALAIGHQCLKIDIGRNETCGKQGGFMKLAAFFIDQVVSGKTRSVLDSPSPALAWT